MASTCADPSSDAAGNGSSKHAWSQVVRSKDAASPTKKPPQLPSADQIQTVATDPQTNQGRHQVQMMAEAGIIPAGIIPSESILDSNVGRVTDARVFDEASVRGEEIIEGSRSTAGDGNVVTANASEVPSNKSPVSTPGDADDVRVSRPPWGKPLAPTESEMNPQPVMGATAWPALTEARKQKKTSDNRKSKEPNLKPLQAASTTSIRDSLSKVSLHSGDVSNHQQGIKNKPSFKGASLGVGRPAFQPIENGASFPEHPELGVHGPSEQPFRQNTHARIKGNHPANPSMDTDRVYHHRNDGSGPFNNNNRKWRNNHRDQGRGWHHYGRGYENAGDMSLLLHEQRIGPRNMPRPPQHFVNMNPGFYPMPQFQNNGMYYMRPGGPEFVQGPPYYPIAPAREVVAPDPFVLRSMLINQVDYYFSVENLCRDVFLRTHMDEEGFVPVSVIADFNRIQRLSTNPLVILEALQHSSVVEVQHDKIRRRNDRGKWRLAPDQVYAVNSMQKNGSVGRGFQGQSELSVNGVLSSSENGKGGSAWEQAADGAEHVWASSDRSSSISDCRVAEHKGEHQDVNDIDLSGRNGSTHLFSRHGSKEENAVSSVLLDDSALCQNLESIHLKEGPPRSHRTLVAANQETCSSHSRFVEGKAWVSQPAAEAGPVHWSAPEGFWMENRPYLMHSGLEKNDVQARESDFFLKIHKDMNEHPEEGTDRELDRPMKVSHKSLGSYIAVP